MTSAITLITAHFDSDLSATSDESSEPQNALAHVAGSEVNWAASGLPTRRRHIRSWLTFWPRETDAAQFLNQRKSHIPLLDRAAEVSIGLLIPFTTHGDVNWFDGPAKPIEMDLAQRPDKSAPIFVITSAGFRALGLGAVAFGQGTHTVRKAIQKQEDVRFEAQILPDNPTTDGATFTLWDNQAAVMNFAYKSEPHKSAMDVTNHDDVVRGSFTRCWVKSFDGIWRGQRISI